MSHPRRVALEASPPRPPPVDERLDKPCLAFEILFRKRKLEHLRGFLFVTDLPKGSSYPKHHVEVIRCFAIARERYKNFIGLLVTPKRMSVRAW